MYFMFNFQLRIGERKKPELVLPELSTAVQESTKYNKQNPNLDKNAKKQEQKKTIDEFKLDVFTKSKKEFQNYSKAHLFFKKNSSIISSAHKDALQVLSDLNSIEEKMHVLLKEIEKGNKGAFKTREELNSAMNLFQDMQEMHKTAVFFYIDKFISMRKNYLDEITRGIEQKEIPLQVLRDYFAWKSDFFKKSSESVYDFCIDKLGNKSFTIHNIISICNSMNDSFSRLKSYAWYSKFNDARAFLTDNFELLKEAEKSYMLGLSGISKTLLQKGLLEKEQKEFQDIMNKTIGGSDALQNAMEMNAVPAWIKQAQAATAMGIVLLATRNKTPIAKVGMAVANTYFFASIINEIKHENYMDAAIYGTMMALPFAKFLPKQVQSAKFFEPAMQTAAVLSTGYIAKDTVHGILQAVDLKKYGFEAEGNGMLFCSLLFAGMFTRTNKRFESSKFDSEFQDAQSLGDVYRVLNQAKKEGYEFEFKYMIEKGWEEKAKLSVDELWRMIRFAEKNKTYDLIPEGPIKIVLQKTMPIDFRRLIEKPIGYSKELNQITKQKIPFLKAEGVDFNAMQSYESIYLVKFKDGTYVGVIQSEGTFPTVQLCKIDMKRGDFIPLHSEESAKLDLDLLKKEGAEIYSIKKTEGKIFDDHLLSDKMNYKMDEILSAIKENKVKEFFEKHKPIVKGY